MGEMPLYYAAADVALLGGSFAPLGGQNLIEAAACGCPVVMGPHTFNFERGGRRCRWPRGRRCAWPTSKKACRVRSRWRSTAERDQWSQRALAFAERTRAPRERMAEIVASMTAADCARRALEAAANAQPRSRSSGRTAVAPGSTVASIAARATRRWSAARS